MKAFNPDEIVGITPSHEFRFSADNEVLRLDKDGFHYKGETIDDAGEAYKLFTDWLRMTQAVDQTLSPDDIV